MILCISNTILKDKVNSELQKNLKLDEDILFYTRYFNSVEEALEENCTPIDFMVSVRSAYSNQVLQRKSGEEFRYYVNMTNVDLLPHKGYDLIMYLSSIGLMSCVNYKYEFNDIMMMSQFIPIGLYNPDPAVINPIIYSHVILSDDTVEAFKTFLKEDIELVPIKDMQTQGNLPAILESIFEVKEEEVNESESDNN